MDHLNCLHALLKDAQVIHMFAPYSLVRAALENASAAVWMLHPSGRATRICRRLRLAVTNIRNGAPDLTVTSGEPRSLTDAPQTPLIVTGPDRAATSRAFASKRARPCQPVQVSQIRPEVAASAEKEAGHHAVRSGL